ncbi:hypothetical protein BCY90_15620 [Agrobacterium deltaense]|nr:hypothetical protein L901_18330 [Agrobacterium sp. D14]RKF41749.1 hypothetical protein BCY90_15620 [Agrobacterium deltaense]
MARVPRPIFEIGGCQIAFRFAFPEKFTHDFKQRLSSDSHPAEPDHADNQVYPDCGVWKRRSNSNLFTSGLEAVVRLLAFVTWTRHRFP